MLKRSFVAVCIFIALFGEDGGVILFTPILLHLSHFSAKQKEM